MSDRVATRSGTTLTIRTPADYLFYRDVCSYGYFLLAPNRWDPASRTLTRILEVQSDGNWLPIRAVLDQPTQEVGPVVRVRCDQRLERKGIQTLCTQIRRMLNLDDEGVKAFHRLDPRWKRSGRARLFRSPTLFEDVIKTVTSCNVAW
ncbi:MAG: hypothetical protein ACNA8P_07335, partial [Phycisphaerales bacterium]